MALAMPELPVEIWAAIFQQLVAIDDTPSCRTTLLLVSRSWFQTAIAVHQLWTHIEVTLAPTTTTNRVLFYLFHCAALPLSVCITILEPSAPAIPNIMHLFAAHLYRIRLLKLRVSSHEVAEKALELIGAHRPAPILEVLSIDVEALPQGESSYWEPYRTTFSSAPRLSHLTIPVFPLPTKESSQLVHCSSLTHLTIGEIPYQGIYGTGAVLQLLCAFINLESFTFKPIDIYCYFDAPDFPIINCARLLSIDIALPGIGLDILTKINAPSLTSVRLDTRREDSLGWEENVLPGGISDALRLLSRRSPLVRDVELRGTFFRRPEEDYRWLLAEAFPQLQVVKLVGTDITDDVLAGISRTSSQLTVFSLQSCIDITQAGVSRFLNSVESTVQLVIEDCPNASSLPPLSRQY
ncbi:hypothetical protein CVT26_010616 [Gymnopilus dilepis]|uniref:F-box domain-containing protein n=1 Tax=Gymnopilus dilepis TaxID=231916 RepID=A0A409W579_9AGAR|nr:hypothetical protein CVT26_010616 [Gymnopilus dilepis]